MADQEELEWIKVLSLGCSLAAKVCEQPIHSVVVNVCISYRIYRKL